MENVRLFFKEIVLPLAEVEDNKCWGITVLNDELISPYYNNIANKIFSINKEDRRTYLNLILSEIDSRMSCPIYDKIEIEGRKVYKKMIENTFHYSFEYKDGYAEEIAKTENYLAESNGQLIDVGNSVVNMLYFISKVFFLFEEFGFNMNEIIKSRVDLDYNYEHVLSLLENTKDGSCRIDDIAEYNIIKKSSTTAYQQYDVMKSILKYAQITNTDDNKVSEFLGWLLNRSPEYIRQHVISNSKRSSIKKEEDNSLIVEKFKLINIDYEDGKIKIK